MTRLVQTELDHIVYLARNLPEDEIEQIESVSGVYHPDNIVLSVLSSALASWTILEEETGTPLVVAGFMPKLKNTLSVFFYATEYAWKAHGREVTKHAISVMKKSLDGDRNMRFEVLCLESRERAQAWYKKIGLTKEATMKSYGVDGKDFALYAITNGD